MDNIVEFDIPKAQSSIIKVIGVGGGGSNAVNYMHAENIEGVDFIICNTDAKALEQSRVENKIQLGPNLTQGLGAGADPEVGRQATEESLEEIKGILEVNTKMAFICAGMGGGTGTGGAPILAKICQELGILTVGIVTTPFSFEGPSRATQAEAGIKELQPYVDTLLVISNDKLRQQYGNLKMREAFSKADNVLATAAKCITDIINSKGHIIVDFNDVCTVMKDGGVAILGSSAVEGDERAQRAIEEALNSPLLNDNDIRGAKWILLNINTSEGDFECNMDEFETISNYVREQAGAGTDAIIGLNYDNTLEKKLGITLIATGFQHKDPFSKDSAGKQAKSDIVTIPLGGNNNGGNSNVAPQIQEDETGRINIPLKTDDPFTQPDIKLNTNSGSFFNPSTTNSYSFNAKPFNFQNGNSNTDTNTNNVTNEYQPFISNDTNADIHSDMSLDSNADESQLFDSSDLNDEQLRIKLNQEKIKKLRSLQYKVNGNDPNNEFETIPAYMRRNNATADGDLSSVETFYSRVEVKKDANDKDAHISTLNTFLDGKKPD